MREETTVVLCISNTDSYGVLVTTHSSYSPINWAISKIQVKAS